MAQFTPPEIWKRHAILLSIRAGSSNTNISECFGVNLRTVQRIRKELVESNGDYEGTAARKIHSVRSDKKRTPEFVSQVKTMILNDPSKSIRSIARDTGVSEFLISRCLGSRSLKEETNNPRPEKFSQSAAAKWKSFDTFSLPKAQHESRPRAEPFVVAVSVGIFLLYFLWLREENDLDLELDKPLYERIPTLEQAQIKAQIRHNERQGLDSEALHLRLQQVKREIRRQGKDE